MAAGLSLLALTLVTFWVFQPVQHAQFVVYDDPRYITENPQVRPGITGAGLVWAFSSVGYACNWHPLTWLSHMCDVQIFGLQPSGHHLVSLLIHTAGAGTLFLVLRAMTGSPWRSLLVAAFFAVHPLHVESAAWVAERKDVLAGFLFMLTIGTYLQYARRPSPARYTLVLLAFLSSLMAKPVTMTLPVVLLLLDWWPLGRIAPQNTVVGSAVARSAGTPLRTLLLEKAPLLGLSVMSLGITYVAQLRGRGFELDDGIPFAQGFPNALVSYAIYLWETVWPANLACFYPLARSGPPLWQSAAAGATLLAFTTAALRNTRRFPFLAVGWLWYLVTLLPTIGILQIGAQARADRYTYLPLVGIFLLAVWWTSALAGPRAGLRILATVAGVGILGSLLPAARAQVGTWHDSLTLFGHASRVVADNWMAEYNLGYLLAETSRFDEAARHLAKALDIRPERLEIRHNLGVCLYELGKVEQAIGHFTQVLRRSPDYAESRYHLGIALESVGRLREAGEQFSALLRLNPNDNEARSRLADILQRLKGRDAR